MLGYQIDRELHQEIMDPRLRGQSSNLQLKFGELTILVRLTAINLNS